MIEFKAETKPKIALLLDGQAEITFTAPKGVIRQFDGLTDKPLTVTVKEFRQKRSLNANNYMWHLVNEIANILRADKDDIYLIMLKRYGQSEIISVLEHIPIKQYIKYCEEVGESTLNGKLFKHYKVFKGSSEFDTREMSILIDGVVSEAKELNIQTLEDLEIKRLVDSWQ